MATEISKWPIATNKGLKIQFSENLRANQPTYKKGRPISIKKRIFFSKKAFSPVRPSL